MPRFILASGSPRRKEILTQIGISFEVIKSECPEDIAPNTLPEDAVKILAERKALDVINNLKNDFSAAPLVILISADTVVSIDNEILGKPRNAEDACNMLKKLSSRKHIVSTGMCVCFISQSSRELFTSVSQSSVYFKKMTDDEIMDYINTGEPMDKAGSYGVQGKCAAFIERLEGDFFSVMGLSVSQLYDILKEKSVSVI